MKILVFGGDSDMAPGIVERFPDASLVTKELCDVTNYEEVETSLKVVQPDTVINLAGVSNLQALKDSGRYPWQEEIAVNLVGAYNIARAGIDLRVKTFIYMGSVAGLYGKGTHSGYCASKAGVISLVQSMAQEGYRAHAISPGRVDTKMREKDFPGVDPKTRLKADEIGRVVKEILDGKFQPGDNVIIRKRGYRTLRRVDQGAPWKKYLNVGGKIV